MGLQLSDQPHAQATLYPQLWVWGSAQPPAHTTFSESLVSQLVPVVLFVMERHHLDSFGKRLSLVPVLKSLNLDLLGLGPKSTSEQPSGACFPVRSVPLRALLCKGIDHCSSHTFCDEGITGGRLHKEAEKQKGGRNHEFLLESTVSSPKSQTNVRARDSKKKRKGKEA